MYFPFVCEDVDCMRGVMSVGLDGPTASLRYWVGAREAGGMCDFFFSIIT